MTPARSSTAIEADDQSEPRIECPTDLWPSGPSHPPRAELENAPVRNACNFVANDWDAGADRPGSDALVTVVRCTGERPCRPVGLLPSDQRALECARLETQA
jgi:hypothetical protein